MIAPCTSFALLPTSQSTQLEGLSTTSPFFSNQKRQLLSKKPHDEAVRVAVFGRYHRSKRRRILFSSNNKNDDENKNNNDKNDVSNNNSNNILDSFFNQFWNSIGMSPESSTSSSSQNQQQQQRQNSVFGWQNMNEKSNNNRRIDNDDDEDDDHNSVAAGTYKVVTIPVKEMKPGGLRLFLMFYLMGEQNTPSRNTWRANQPDRRKRKITALSNNMKVEEDEEEYVVDFRYVADNTAALSIILRPNSIRIYRIGSTPSNSYMMQEAIILQGILNELDQCATDDRVQLENRLLILHENNINAIQNAKDALAFG